MKKRDRKLLLEIEAKKSEEKSNHKELAPIERGFYRRITEELSEMHLEFLELSERKKFSEAMQVNDEMKKIKKAVRELIQFRLRKILKFAVWEKREIKNMTPEEIELYTDIRNRIAMFENSIFGRVGEDMESVSAVKVEAPAVEDENLREKETRSVAAQEAAGPAEVPVKSAEEERSAENMVLVRVKSEVGRFALPGDVVFNLRKEDVLHLPEKVYKILARMDKVELLRLEE